MTDGRMMNADWAHLSWLTVSLVCGCSHAWLPSSRINVSNPCMNLQIEGKTITHPVVAQIPLEIKEPPVPLPNPCLYSQHGRWLLKDDGKYR